jgi:hypothetical protein
MTAVYGTQSRTAYGIRTNTTISVPASTTTGNLLLWIQVCGANSPVIPTLPGTFTQLGTAQTREDSGGYDLTTVMGYRIVQGGDGSSYTATHGSSDAEAAMIRITGTNTLSVDVYSQADDVGPGVPTVAIASSVTPTQTDDLLIFSSLNWNFANLSPPTGMTEILEAEHCYIATQALVSSSATGTRSHTTDTNYASPWYANLIAIKDVAGGGGATARPIFHRPLKFRTLYR